jgi:peptidoglycan hydrolase-like protein with peptidoglycan-binding domain
MQKPTPTHPKMEFCAMFSNFMQNLGGSLLGDSKSTLNLSNALDDGPEISQSVGLKGKNAPKDIAKVETLLGAHQALDLSKTDGPTGYMGQRLDQGIKRFQKSNGLKIDGVINPAAEMVPGVGKLAKAPFVAADSLKNMGEIAHDLANSGVSPTGQRIGAYAVGLTSAFGGKGTRKALKPVLDRLNSTFVKKFGLNLSRLTPEEFVAINKHLLNEGLTLGAKGLVMTVGEATQRTTQKVTN